MSKGWRLFAYLVSYAISQSGDWLFIFVIPLIVTSQLQTELEAGIALAMLGLMQGIASLFGGIAAPMAMNRSAKTALLLRLNLLLAAVSLGLAIAHGCNCTLLVVFLLVTLKAAVNGLYTARDLNFGIKTKPCASSILLRVSATKQRI